MNLTGKKLLKFRVKWIGSCSVCTQVPNNTCPRLRTISNAAINQPNGDKLSAGSKATYRCDSNHTLFRGNLERYCKGNGAWSGDEPRCEVERNQITFI